MRVRRQRWYDTQRENGSSVCVERRSRILSAADSSHAARHESSGGINNFYGAKIKIEISLTGAPFHTSPRRFSSCRRISIVEVDAPTLRYAKFIFRDPPGEAFWKFTTGSNGVEQKCQSRLRGGKKSLCRFVSRRYGERRGRYPASVDTHFVSIRTFLYSGLSHGSGRIRDNRICTRVQICMRYLF